MPYFHAVKHCFWPCEVCLSLPAVVPAGCGTVRVFCQDIRSSTAYVRALSNTTSTYPHYGPASATLTPPKPLDSILRSGLGQPLLLCMQVLQCFVVGGPVSQPIIYRRCRGAYTWCMVSNARKRQSAEPAWFRSYTRQDAACATPRVSIACLVMA